MTQTSPIISVNKVGHNHPNTVGPARPNIEVRLGGDQLQVAPTAMKGYWNREEATKAIFTEDGGLTGDVCTIYPDGTLPPPGRIKEIIVTSTGEKVPPADLGLPSPPTASSRRRMVVVTAPSVHCRRGRQPRMTGLPRARPRSRQKPSLLQDPAFRKAALKRITKTATAGFPAYGVPRQVHCRPRRVDASTTDSSRPRSR